MKVALMMMATTKLKLQYKDCVVFLKDNDTISKWIYFRRKNV